MILEKTIFYQKNLSSIKVDLPVQLYAIKSIIADHEGDDK